jgi:hypothetical protein
MNMNRNRANRWDDDETSYDDEEDRYDDSQGYSEDSEEDEEYQEFLEREFGGGGTSKRSRWQFWTAIVFLVSFAFPLVSYLLWAISQ